VQVLDSKENLLLAETRFKLTLDRGLKAARLRVGRALTEDAGLRQGSVQTLRHLRISLDLSRRIARKGRNVDVEVDTADADSKSQGNGAAWSETRREPPMRHLVGLGRATWPTDFWGTDKSKPEASKILALVMNGTDHLGAAMLAETVQINRQIRNPFLCGKWRQVGDQVS